MQKEDTSLMDAQSQSQGQGEIPRHKPLNMICRQAQNVLYCQ